MCRELNLLTIFFLFGILFESTDASAQVGVKRFYLDELSFEYVSKSKNSCVKWLGLEDNRPSIKTDDKEAPYVIAEVRAELAEGCELVFSGIPKPKVKKSSDGATVFEVEVKPPVTIAVAKGANTNEQLLFEAPIEGLQGLTFFNVFNRSRVHFDLSTVQFKTNKSDADPSKSWVLPVFGGGIVVPVPWIDWLYGGFSLYHNLGSWVTQDGLDTNFTEVTFELRYVWTGSAAIGSPFLSGVMEYRGRNIFQLGTDRVYVIGGSSQYNIGFDASTNFGGLISSRDSFFGRMGLETEFRYKLPSTAAGGAFNAWHTLVGLRYQLAPKWQLGLGYKYLYQSLDQTDQSLGQLIKETGNFVQLRLSLVPAEEGL